MMCAWKEFLSVIPAKLRQDVDAVGKEQLQELRLRINSPPELILNQRIHLLPGRTTREEMDYVISAASRYSPWCSSSISKGYLTAPGGHRIGICGEVVHQNGRISGVKNITSLCIRVARDISGIAGNDIPRNASILIIGAPGWGKTTLLRDLIRKISEKESVGVVDERGELFPDTVMRGNRTDILTGCSKNAGISMLLRTMSPSWIAVDEITEASDCDALNYAANCGVKLLATAHAGSYSEFCKRTAYQSLIREEIFPTVICLNKEKKYYVEEGIP